MKTFCDTTGHEWTIDLTIGAVKSVRDLLGVNLLEIDQGDPPLITRLCDVILLCDVIYVLVKPQADELKITDEQFGRQLGGEGMLAAQEAFYAELIDFFRQVGRTDLAVAMTKQGEFVKIVVARAEEKISELNLDEKIDELLEESSKPSTSSPESSDLQKPNSMP